MANFNYRGRAKQLLSFKGLKYGNITPTDIDALIEYQDKAYVYVEVKYKDAPVPLGQRIALERMVKDTPLNKKSIVIVCEHEVDFVEDDVELIDCKVRDVYLSNDMKWNKGYTEYNVKDLIDMFLSGVDLYELGDAL